MITGILGTKIGMSQIVNNENGNVTPVTYVLVEANEIVQLKTEEKDGYIAVVVGANPYNKPTKNKKFKNLREFRVDSLDGFKVGDKADLSHFEGIEELTITGYSKGRGFSGPVKRWNRSIARKTHGTKYIRHGSTMNSCITGRSKKGIKMAGQFGNDKTTLKARKVEFVDAENNVVAIRGSVPGANGGLVILRKA